MFGREDFSSVRIRWDDFWEKKLPRPVVSIVLPKKGCEPAEPPAYLEGFLGDYQKVADKVAKVFDTHIYLGEAVPYYSMEFGSDTFASFLGADLVLSPLNDTSWPNKTLDTLIDAEIAFDPNGKWWQKTVEFYTVLRRTLGDRVMVSAPTLTAGLDCLVALYGAEKLLFAMVDQPERVKHVLRQIDQAYTDVLDACADVFEYDKYGSINRHGMYCSGKIGVPQCDFSCMLSPSMFEEFAIPSIEQEISKLDAAEYHLDGPGALHHLERLARIDALDIIQWVPGAGDAELRDWTDLYKKIVALGKGLILGVKADRFFDVVRQYPTKRMFLSVYGLQTRAQADGLLERIDSFYESFSENETSS